MKSGAKWQRQRKVLLGDDNYMNTLHDYIWSICEETTWVLPQVEHLAIELRAVATGFDLAEIIVSLEDKLEERGISGCGKRSSGAS